jgi:hypothetical protein
MEAVHTVFLSRIFHIFSLFLELYPLVIPGRTLFRNSENGGCICFLLFPRLSVFSEHVRMLILVIDHVASSGHIPLEYPEHEVRQTSTLGNCWSSWYLKASIEAPTYNYTTVSFQILYLPHQLRSQFTGSCLIYSDRHFVVLFRYRRLCGYGTQRELSLTYFGCVICR